MVQKVLGLAGQFICAPSRWAYREMPCRQRGLCSVKVRPTEKGCEPQLRVARIVEPQYMV
jgi:hypothetical protein